MYSWDSILYYFDPNDASLMYNTAQSHTGVRQGYPLGTLMFHLTTCTPFRNIGERCIDSSAIKALHDDGKISDYNGFFPTVIADNTEELGKVSSTV
jgi:hypothetical protein